MCCPGDGHEMQVCFLGNWQHDRPERGCMGGIICPGMLLDGESRIASGLAWCNTLSLPCPAWWQHLQTQSHVCCCSHKQVSSLAGQQAAMQQQEQYTMQQA